MFDARSEPREFIADSTAAAIAKATEFFGVPESELTVRKLSSEVSGLGNRALIVALPSAARSARPRRAGRSAEPERERREGGRERGRGGRSRERREQRPQTQSAAAAARPEPTAPSVATVQGTLGPAGEFVRGVVERMDLGPFEISEVEEDRFVAIQLRGEACSGLVAGDGRAVDAIQLLANQAASQADEEAKRVVVDLKDGSRDKRESQLERLAERAARRATDTGRAVALDPMSGKDRRCIHVALRDTPGVATMSIGEGRYRQVLVVPEGAPEYEEARRASEASSRGD